MTAPSAPAFASPMPNLIIRSIRPDDAQRLRAFHARLSEDTIRNRFFGPHRFLAESEVLRFTSPAAGHEVALAATSDEVIIGVARAIRLGSGDVAEVAFVVEDAYQHHGIGTGLLTLLAHLAWDDGIQRFVADTFATNRAMLGVFTHTPEAVRVTSSHREGSALHLVMDVVPPGADLVVMTQSDRAPARRGSGAVKASR